MEPLLYIKLNSVFQQREVKEHQKTESSDTKIVSHWSFEYMLTKIPLNQLKGEGKLYQSCLFGARTLLTKQCELDREM